ncbi:NADH:flavin oxidoreductase [Mangrovibacterium lignilyticum]|uniref:NADH:flavin oxidoreductase n=1 Tax=Mangrovibacterium lignilyticum TaxID=2668052 RepID=UPI0013D24E6B|nr:NADH:flavin oxidoreductase [Mangrovibacterium lignilyticum]
MELFERAYIGKCELSNRIIRSATFEGMCDEKGFPTETYRSFYEQLSKNKIGGIITGFSYISDEGKAMQPGQAGIYSPEFIPYYKRVTTGVHANGGKIFMQLAHTGRQTREQETGKEVVGVSTKRSPYFKSKPRTLKPKEINEIIEKFGDSALYAQMSGFDGIQLHAAHGYLIHQFIFPKINNRTDQFGIDKKKGIGTKFLDLIIANIREKCGEDYPILIKISGGDDHYPTFGIKQLINLIRFLDEKAIDAIEISYGTMDYALNIFRGDMPIDLILAKNKVFRSENRLEKHFIKLIYFPLFKRRLKPFSSMYNLAYASLATKYTTKPIISVGGFRTGKEMEHAVKIDGINFIGLCRPFICEPDFVVKIETDSNYKSKCLNCNYCAIMCDTQSVTQCYKTKSNGNTTESNSNNSGK